MCMLIHIPADTSSPIKFTRTPLHSPPPGPIPHLGQCGVSGSGCCWLVGGIAERMGADELGARDSFQTFGAALVQAKQSDRSFLPNWSPHSPQHYRSEEVRTFLPDWTPDHPNNAWHSHYDNRLKIKAADIDTVSVSVAKVKYQTGASDIKVFILIFCV